MRRWRKPAHARWRKPAHVRMEGSLCGHLSPVMLDLHPLDGSDDGDQNEGHRNVQDPGHKSRGRFQALDPCLVEVAACCQIYDGGAPERHDP